MQIVTKYQLMTALFCGGSLEAHGVNLAIVNRVERESGSGRDFNVHGYTSGGTVLTVYVQTID